MAKTRICLFFLLCVLPACNPYLGQGVYIRYTPAGVCQKFSVATMNEQSFDLQIDANLEVIGTVDPKLPPLQITAPQQPTDYRFLVGGYAGSTVPLDLEFTCLPNKPPVRVKFNVLVSSPGVLVKVTEAAAKVEGLEVAVESRP